LLGGRSESGISGDKSQPSQGGQDYWLVKVALSGMDTSSVVQVEEDTETFKANREKIAVNPASNEITELNLNVRPNPFSEKLQVHFTLPKSELVNLKVYNSQGQLVSTLFQGQADAGKSYEFQWQPESKQATGLYLLRLHTSTKTQTEKVILTK
ncbi:MAG: T9SS type A sorting domain-containing protein, partial [Bacteroidota bacterium]|nr:T9SS type A sorting domain-containing protein [Bacteroidota bacterium]